MFEIECEMIEERRRRRREKKNERKTEKNNVSKLILFSILSFYFHETTSIFVPIERKKNFIENNLTMAKLKYVANFSDVWI